MNAIEFALWLNGAAELVGDEPPTQEQWTKMRDKLGEAVGAIAAAKLLERASRVQQEMEQKERYEDQAARLRERMGQRTAGYAASTQAFQDLSGKYAAAVSAISLDMAVPEPPPTVFPTFDVGGLIGRFKKV